MANPEATKKIDYHRGDSSIRWNVGQDEFNMPANLKDPQFQRIILRP
jgi:hypothetical protein